MKKICITLIAIALCFCSCKKETPPLGPLLIPSATDPYSGNYPMSGYLYYLIQRPIADTGKSEVCQIYMNRRNALPFSDDGNVYYNPVPKLVVVQFGENIIANILEFKDSINTRIKQQHYAIVGRFLENGPENERWWSIR